MIFYFSLYGTENTCFICRSVWKTEWVWSGGGCRSNCETSRLRSLISAETNIYDDLNPDSQTEFKSEGNSSRQGEICVSVFLKESLSVDVDVFAHLLRETERDDPIGWEALQAANERRGAGPQALLIATRKNSGRLRETQKNWGKLRENQRKSLSLNQNLYLFYFYLIGRFLYWTGMIDLFKYELVFSSNCLKTGQIYSTHEMLYLSWCNWKSVDVMDINEKQRTNPQIHHIIRAGVKMLISKPLN